MGYLYKKSVSDQKLPLSNTISRHSRSLLSGNPEGFLKGTGFRLKTCRNDRLSRYFRGNDDQKGLTLIEVMIALVILLLVMLALMQTALVSIDSNMVNVLRDEAVGIAEMRMNEARNTAFDSLATDSESLPAGVDCPATFTDGSANGELIQRSIRNIPAKDFCSRRVIGSGDTSGINVEVIWRWKEQDYTHSISTIVRRQ